MIEFLTKLMKMIAEFLASPLSTEKKALTEIDEMPVYKDRGKHVLILQKALNKVAGFKLTEDGDFGKKTRDAVVKFQKAKGSTGTGVIGPKTLNWLGLVLVKKEEKPGATSPEGQTPWMDEIRKDKGKHETDKKFAAKMVPQWPLVGLKLKTIAKNWAAWCGLAIGVYLAAVGLPSQRDGALAKNWAKYGVAIDYKKNGIPEGAIVHINHKKCGSSSSNHVTFADGDCSAAYVNKSGATFNGLGGNQGNRVKVSTYKVSRICAVRWPKSSKYPVPKKIMKSKNCSSGAASYESTR